MADEVVPAASVVLSPEQRAQAVNVLLEDFRARWTELLNFEGEVSRWFTLYVTAVIGVIGWVMGQSGTAPPPVAGAHGIQALLKQNDGLNTGLVLLLAFVNAVYTLALAFNGYRIQQIGQYLYSHVGLRLTLLTREPFDIWEDWRRKIRETPGAYGPELIRKGYYIAISFVPIIVSVGLLTIYWWFEGRTQARLSGHNLGALFVLASTLAMGVLAWRTSAQNDQWERLIDQRIHEEGQDNIKRREFFLPRFFKDASVAVEHDEPKPGGGQKTPFPSGGPPPAKPQRRSTRR